MITSSRIASLLLFLLFIVGGCSGEKLSTDVIPLGPISSDPNARSATPSTSTDKAGAPSAPVGTLVRRAERLVETKNFPGAIAALEEALSAEPTNRKALRLLAELTERLAEDIGRPKSSPLYLRSARAVRALKANYMDLTTEETKMIPLILYNEACTLALNGESLAAVNALKESLDAGFAKPEQIDIDEELDSIRHVPEFIEYQRKLEAVNIKTIMDLTSAHPFQFDFKLPGIDGKELALGSLKGKVVIVDMWGTWCPPCRKELPHLISLYRRYHEKGLEIVGINYETDTGEAAVKQVRSFIKEQGIPYPCVIGDEATRKQVYGFEGYPTTLFLDRQGRVRLKLSGYHSIIPLEVAMETLLGEKEAGPAAKP